jgi:2-beta-glucuronyltransferase
MKVVLVSGHDALADRRTGFHFWKDILDTRGASVDFITVGSSLLSLIKPQGKHLRPPYNQWVQLSPNARKYTWVPPFHPIHLKYPFLNALVAPVFSLYPKLFPKHVLESFADADYFIVENGAGPMLAPLFEAAAPNARLIYNASDRIGVVKFHPVIARAAIATLPHFNLVRCNAAALADDFPAGTKTVYIPQGLDTALFDQVFENPYTNGRNAISIGDMLFDADAISTLANSFPNWHFHIFGKGAVIDNPPPNVKLYGEVPFSKLVPFIQHADIGLAPYRNAPDADYLSQSSLKMVQYTYCRLPIVAPHFAATGRAHVLGYDPDKKDSAAAAFSAAIDFDRNNIDRSTVLRWDEVLDKIMEAAR